MADENACQEWLFRYQWPDGFVCPHCGEVRYYKVPGRIQYECAGCGRQIALTNGTIMYKSRIPLYKWFGAVALYNADKEISAAELGRQLCLTKPTAWLMLKKIRAALKTREGRLLLAKIAEWMSKRGERGLA
ncbi:hypothetical protein AGMMS50293_21600 [Spirochaetia bacterium]|nr:hypothetical protein AGMMS50293_21600 [Spirochaetia bacterium]